MLKAQLQVQGAPPGDWAGLWIQILAWVGGVLGGALNPHPWDGGGHDCCHDAPSIFSCLAGYGALLSGGGRPVLALYAVHAVSFLLWAVLLATVIGKCKWQRGGAGHDRVNSASLNFKQGPCGGPCCACPPLYPHTVSALRGP